MRIMTRVCLYFQMHQPVRLRRFSVMDSKPNYFDEPLNEEILRRVAQRCYLPGCQLMLDLIQRHGDQFALNFSVTGVLLEQFKRSWPQVIDLLSALADTGQVQFLSETYHHSLAFLYSRDEFREQIEQHDALVEELFGQTPTVFRNTELIYNNDLAHYIASLNRYRAILSEGVDRVLQGRPTSRMYHPPHTPAMKVLLKHYRLSDDIAFRFADRSWTHWPLTAEKFTQWVDDIAEQDDANASPMCNIFMDMEAIGEHQPSETGIFQFLAALPEKLIAAGHRFCTMDQLIDQADDSDEFDAPNMISWADTERDLSAWLGNAMQANALHELFKMEREVKTRGDEELLRDWRLLSASDHFYYMCTKYFADGEVHKYFNPYESPYDSYINFMNVLDHMRTRMRGDDR